MNVSVSSKFKVAERGSSNKVRGSTQTERKRGKLVRWSWVTSRSIHLFGDLFIYHCRLPPLSPHPGVFTSPLVTQSIRTSGWLACHKLISYGLDVKGTVPPKIAQLWRYRLWRRLPSLKYDITRWHYTCGSQSAKEKTFERLGSNVSFQELWTVSWKNYFLSVSWLKKTLLLSWPPKLSNSHQNNLDG